MKKDTPDSFDDFLTEMSASLKSPSGEAALRRINAERVLKLVLDEIVEQRHDLQIRVLSDNRISGEPGADILMQVDDYEIRVELIDAPNLIPNLDVDKLRAYKQIFEENPSTEALIITWTSDDLLSQKLSLMTIDHLIENRELIKGFLQKAKPLSDVVQEILTIQMRVWKDIPSLTKKETNISTDVNSIFAKYFEIEIKAEREHSFINEEKKLAVKQFPEKQEMKVVNNVLQDALKEYSTEDLASNLAQLPRRGAK